MKFALVDDQRIEAQPNLSGRCPSCGQVMLAKCGDIKVWHWAHKGRRICDHWWENETEWHRAWKGQFPEGWHEIVHESESGEKHIADIKTDQDWVIEFQHSRIDIEERRSRDNFYKKLIWVVDGTRRKKDPTQFANAVNEGITIGEGFQFLKVRSDGCALLREWSGSNVPIFLDFGDRQVLWWLIAGRPDGWSYLASLPCMDFIEIHCGKSKQPARNFDEFLMLAQKHIADYASNARAQTLNATHNHAFRNAQRNMARKNRGRGRF